MRFPSYLKKKLILGSSLSTKKILNEYNLNTVCDEAKCPNKQECFSKKTATFLALGNECTRSCAFCDIKYSKNPKPIDTLEPKNIALATKKLNLKHVVITMVSRDDLEDRGANHIANIIKEIKKTNPTTSIETLTSDFDANFDLIDIILNEGVDIFNYNIEAVKEISSKIRHKATYENSLKIISYVKKSKKTKYVKSGFMVGLGETKPQVFETLKDLKRVNCDIVTIGQYLSPGKNKYPTKAFITPEEFREFEAFAKKINIKKIYASSFVRSSYNAISLIN